MRNKYENNRAASGTNEDGWPWPLLLLVALKELNISEDEFWKMTPIKFSALVDALGELNSTDDETNKNKKHKKEEVFTTVDNIPGW